VGHQASTVLRSSILAGLGSAVGALNVKEWLAQPGLDPDNEIAIKRAETNDLNSPENRDLLSLRLSGTLRTVTEEALQLAECY
jgi:hypothetical protein